MLVDSKQGRKQVTPREIAEFAARHIGKPVSLYNDHTGDAISGTIDEVSMVAGHLWIRRAGGGRTITGLPNQPVTPRRQGRDVVFENVEVVSKSLTIRYRLTITT